jgi:Tfp pilus assembly protein PilE
MRRSSTVGLVVAVAVILLLALVAWGQWRAAVQQREAAETARAAAVVEADLCASAQAETEAAQQELATRLQRLDKQRQCALAWQLLVQAQVALDDTGAGFVRTARGSDG